MPMQLITPPTEEPISLFEAKQHLRVDTVEDDTLIAAFVTAAREAAEALTGRQMINARWKLVLDGFPGRFDAGEAETSSSFTFLSVPANAILLTKCPVQSIVAIDYLDMNGSWQTMDAQDYVLDKASEPARLTPAFGASWPVALPQIGAVTVTFDAGYGAAAAVPEGIKSWIKLRVGSLYAHREEQALLTRGRIDPLPFVDALLDPYRINLI